MAVEHAPPGKRAFYGSWPQCGIPAGLVLATVAFYFVEQLPDAAMISWGWRIPFLASAVLVALGLYVRVKISESPAFQQSLEQGEQAKFPVVEVVRKAWKPILVAILSMAAANVPFYMATVFALQYGPEHVGVSRDTVLMAVCVASLIQVATIPLAAMLADRYGRRPVLLAGSVITVLEGFPLFWLIDTGSTAAITLAMVLALPVAHALTYSPLAGITEPGAGSDVASMRSTLTGAEDGYRLNGSKTFITTGDRADVIICFATVDREKGRKGITAFALDGASPGLERGKPFDKMGMHGSSTAELFFDQVPVPAAHLLGPEGDGWRVVMNSVIKSRISAAAQGVGLARAAYGRTLAALTRLHGDKIPDEAAFALATLRGELLQGRLLLYGVAREVDRAATPNAGQIGIMKQSCTDLGFSAAREAMRILGPYGDLAELGVERCLRDAKVTQIYDGTNEVQRLLIARDSTRRLEGNRS